jgi:hypothetical protein
MFNGMHTPFATQVNRENVASNKKIANGRSMYVWIGMYAVAVPMFLFVVIIDSVAFEIKEKESLPSFFSSSLRLYGLAIILTRIPIGYVNKKKKRKEIQ